MPGGHTCDICSKGFVNAGALKTHIKFKHAKYPRPDQSIISPSFLSSRKRFPVPFWRQFVSASIVIGMVWVAAMNPETGRTVFHVQPSTYKDGDKRKKNRCADKRNRMSHHRKAEILQDFLDAHNALFQSG